MKNPRLTRLAIVLTALGVAASCSTDDGSGTEQVDDAGFPVTIEHQYGATTLESRPEAVVSVGFNDQDFMLALGRTPIGTRAFSGYDYQNRPWAREQLGGQTIPEVGEMTINVEQVAALGPDLVLGTYSVMGDAVYDTLAALAPTVGDLPTEDVEAGAWQSQLEAIGQALGESDRAQEVRQEVEGAFTAAREANPQFEGRTLAVALYLGDSFYILEAEDPRTSFFTSLGFAMPEEAGDVSAERLDLLDQQNLAVLGATREQLAADPLFSNLAVVREDRTVYLGEFGTDVPAALGFASPLSLPFALDETVPSLAQATDDDPATVVAPVGAP